jgi:peptidoglycan/LPS O-acetylase OafA/YrhL
MSNTKVHKGRSRFAELDGLRAMAVISVVMFHCDITDVLNAGFFGVDVFFAISGFIITANLLKEYRSEGAFQFMNFYFRRLKRLLPPVLGLILIAFVVTAIISEEALQKFVADTPAALLYGSNWWQIFDNQDYFDTTPHVLRHLWSLAVEEQFYIIWPPVMYLILKRCGPKAVGTLALVGVVASTVWMWYLYELNLDATDQNRIYVGTDTHAMGLLVGAALACFWNPWVPRKKGSRMSGFFWHSAALLSLGLLGCMATTMNTSDPRLYHGAFLLAPILTCVVGYVSMSDPSFFVSAILRHPVTQWFGSRSYSLYLVHWPVFVWMKLLHYKDFSNWQVLLPSLAIVIVVSELMYRCVEVPSKAYELKMPGISPKVVWMGAYVIFAIGFSAAMTFVGVKPQVEVANALPGATSPRLDKPVPAAAAPEAASSPEDVDPADAKIRISGGENLYALGDSVLLGAEDHLRKIIPGMQIDAAVGRQASQGLKIVREWHRKLANSSTVLVHLGTNGYINEGQFRDLLKELAECKSVILINVHADRRWTEPNNEIIVRMTHEFRNTHLVDWSLVSANRPEFFVKDGIHLTRRGILAFTSQIKMATGGDPLPEAEADAKPAIAKARRVAHMAADGDAKASDAKASDFKSVEEPMAAKAAPQATAEPPASSAALAAPGPARDQAMGPGEVAHSPTPAPASDPQAE